MSTAHQGSVRTLPTFGGGNANRAAPLYTEPTRSRWCKSTITLSLSPPLSVEIKGHAPFHLCKKKIN